MWQHMVQVYTLERLEKMWTSPSLEEVVCIPYKPAPPAGHEQYYQHSIAHFAENKFTKLCIGNLKLDYVVTSYATLLCTADLELVYIELEIHIIFSCIRHNTGNPSCYRNIVVYSKQKIYKIRYFCIIFHLSSIMFWETLPVQVFSQYSII